MPPTHLESRAASLRLRFPSMPPMLAHDPDTRPMYATERLGALSDGVFAIVLTLLVLDLKIPELPPGFAEQEMLDDLRAQVPNVLAWLVSFALLARFWVVHHDVLAGLQRCHTGTMVRNFVVLGCASLVPFGASLIGTYEYDPLAVAVFTIVLGSTGFSIGVLARHVATERALHHPSAASHVWWHWQYHAWVLPAFVVVSLGLLAFEERAAVGVWAVEPIGAWFAAARRRRGGSA